MKDAASGKTKKVCDKDVMAFKMEWKEFMIKLVTKIFEKSPLKYSLARNLTFLDPRQMSLTSKESYG